VAAAQCQSIDFGRILVLKRVIFVEKFKANAEDFRYRQPKCKKVLGDYPPSQGLAVGISEPEKKP
jgi:hypothetical protein